MRQKILKASLAEALSEHLCSCDSYPHAFTGLSERGVHDYEDVTQTVTSVQSLTISTHSKTLGTSSILVDWGFGFDLQTNKV
jgi:hypothetical protein